ncbi:MAG: hypothetical protein AB1598_13775 [Thermodesulfobacteriota bacterium]
MKSSRRKFLKTVAAGVIGGEIISGAAPAVFAKTEPYADGFEVQKGFKVFNETTQKNMMKLAEIIIPGCGNIGMKDKLMRYLYSSKGTASFFDAGFWNLDAVSRKYLKVPFYELEKKKDIDAILKRTRAVNRGFFDSFRKIVVQFYYSDPRVWKTLSYDGPPQPRGFMDYSEPPKPAKKG